jgi:hypothetical protein
MFEDTELTAAEPINAELANGHGPYSVEECKTLYGAAFEALVQVLHKQVGK